MRRCLGLAVSRTMIRAVALERRRVAWAAERAIAGPEEIGQALAELAADRPRGVTRARVVLEGELVQVKVLDGFPRLAAARVRRAVALQAGRWFLRNGKALATGAMRLDGPRVLAIAAECHVLDRIADGLAQAGLALEGIGAAVAACAPLLSDGEHMLPADRVADRIALLRHDIQSLRRVRTAAGAGSDREPVNEDRFECGDRFFTAYAAAIRQPAPRLDAARSNAERDAGRRRWAIRLAGAAVLAWLTAGVAFAARVTATARRAQTERAALGPALDAAIAVERDLALADELWRTIEGARRDRSRDVLLLSALTTALPDSAHLTVLRRGQDGQVTLGGYARSAARVLAALAETPGVVGPVLQSGITSETLAGRPRERFAIAFRWQPPEGKP